MVAGKVGALAGRYINGTTFDAEPEQRLRKELLSLGFRESGVETMYSGQTACPVILRTPVGGGKGYGPTHSQSLEKHFLGVPHLKIIAASLVHDPLRVFECLLSQNDPALYLEHKLLYPLNMAVTPQGAPGSPLAAAFSRRCADLIVHWFVTSRPIPS